MKRVVVTGIMIFSFLLIGTLIGIFYAKGYRIVPNNGSPMVEGTGLLVLTSKPDAAKVFVNNQIATATNNTINLTPGDYEIKIVKDGYFAWNKKITIKKEVVSRADALLFPTAPKLESTTSTGAQNPVLDSTETLIAYTVSSASAQKNGIYVLDMNSKPILNIGGASTQIADNSFVDFSNALLEFSPDGTQLLATVSLGINPATYLLSTKGFSDRFQDVTETILQIKNTWEKQKAEKIKKLIDDQNNKLTDLINENFQNPTFSLEQDTVLYEASRSANIPILITPRVIGTDSTPEERNIQKGNLYVYDIKEDRNYLIFDRSQLRKDENMPRFTWYPDSRHLVFVKDRKINVTEYDGGNVTTVYAGPFVDDFVFPWNDGNSLVILTNLNIDEAPINLYRLILK
ncbi:MAG: hypothetical protein A2857_01835 [Candidatus Levybacteria bacterium RIFCSPHIGHO2_01_FULL_36_15]|nr:MAG: hypothetical protein A2857_01835 [Candidatus Levybacteria bacterium RIFCSPHIGHO2_01_FULL_36_15]